MNKPLAFNLVYVALALLLAVAGVFGYNSFTPDPQVAAVVQLLVVLVPLIVNLFTHRAAQAREAELTRELTARTLHG